MILTTLLVGTIVIGGVGLIALFWNELIDFLKNAVSKVKKMVAGIVYGFKVFVRKTKEGIQEISRHYSKVNEHWEETTVTREVPESEVPPEILERANANMELDITDELEMELKNA